MTIEQALTTAIASGTIAGAVALVGNKDGITHSAAVGLANPETDAPMQVDTIFQIASMTKAVTSVAAMQLVERGLLTLDSDFGALMPELANPQVLTGFDADGKPTLRRAATPVTLRHLLTHTSGFGYSFMNGDMARAQGDVVPGTLASLASPLLFDPGTKWEYGISTDWVGRAVEAASGDRLCDYMAAHIIAPLGMSDTGFTPGGVDPVRRAALLGRQEDGNLMPFPIEMGGGEGREFDAGGAGLLSTAGDYMRFLRMFLNGGTLDGKTILKPETVAEMSRNQIGMLRAGRMESIVPQFAHVFDSFPDQHTGWGLGFLINPETGLNGRPAGSLAWAGIANTFYWIDPTSEIVAVLMMQFLPFGDPDAIALLGAFERAVYSKG